MNEMPSVCVRCSAPLNKTSKENERKMNGNEMNMNGNERKMNGNERKMKWK